MINFELSKDEQKEFINLLIRKNKEEWMSAKIQAHVYELEAIKPKNISKAQAEEGMGIYQKRMVYLAEIIYTIELYARNHDIII